MRSSLLLIALVHFIAPTAACQNHDSYAPSDADVASYGAFGAGDAVSIEWRGDWYPGRILEVDGDRFKVTYDGHGEFWDEWLTAERLRATTTDGGAHVEPVQADTYPAEDRGKEIAAAAPSAPATPISGGPQGTWQYQSWVSDTQDRGRAELLNGDVFYWLTLRENGNWTLSSTTRWSPSSPDFMNWGTYTLDAGVLTLNQTSAENPVYGRYSVELGADDDMVLSEFDTGDVIRLTRGR